MSPFVQALQEGQTWASALGAAVGAAVASRAAVSLTFKALGDRIHNVGQALGKVTARTDSLERSDSDHERHITDLLKTAGALDRRLGRLEIAFTDHLEELHVRSAKVDP